MTYQPPTIWQYWFGMYADVAVTTLSLLPVALLAVGVLVLLRGRGRHAWRRSVAEVAIVYGTLPSLWITMLPGSMAGLSPGTVSLEPLADLPTMSTFQVVGNLLLLAALGFFAPVRFRWLATLPRVVLLAACCSVGVETAQYVLRLDRVSSVDDVLLNTTGAAVAAVLSMPWWGYTGAGPSASSISRTRSSTRRAVS